MDNKTLLALIDAIINDRIDDCQKQIDELPRIRGPRGLRGPSGKSFNFDDHKEEIRSIIDSTVNNLRDELKLKLSDLTDDELNSLKLTYEDLTDDQKITLKGPRGQRGKQGRSLTFDDCKEQIFEELESLFNESKESFKIKFNDLTDQEKEELTLKFEQLTDEQKLYLKGETGERGPRGLRGQRGKQGETGERGPMGLRGLPGVSGPRGLPGIDGVDGRNASEIIEIEIDQISRDTFVFIFYFSDGSRLETNRFEIPSITAFTQSYIRSGGGGVAGTTLEIQKDGSSLGLAEIIDFEGDNIIVNYDNGTKKATVSITPKCLSISDEGVEQTNCATSINFLGDLVTVYPGTVLEDWPTLAAVVPSLADYQPNDNSNITVEIANPNSTPRQVIVRKANEALFEGDPIYAISNTHVGLASSTDTFNRSQCIGFALADAAISQDVNILISGVMNSTVFNIFNVNDPLFLDDGGVSDEIPVGANYRTICGKSFGSGDIFVNISDPTILTP